MRGSDLKGGLGRALGLPLVRTEENKRKIEQMRSLWSLCSQSSLSTALLT